jgi:uncharacterized coiled-coil DUF342 family protein
MKSLMGFACILLIGICAAMAHYTVQTETHAERWNDRVTSLEHVEELNMNLVRAMEYSELAMNTSMVLATANDIMCKRDAKMVQVVAAFEEENRALKRSLSESVCRLEGQLEEINDLIDENEELVDKINELRDQASDLKKQIATLERAIDKLTEPEPMTVPPIIDINGNPVKGPE